MRFTSLIMVAMWVAGTLHARPARKWTQQELFDEADLVAIVTADAPQPVSNTHEFIDNDKHFDDYLQRPKSGRDPTPKYLVYLKKRSDGKFDPVTGQLDPPDSIVRIIPFPERDPAMDDIQETPEP